MKRTLLLLLCLLLLTACGTPADSEPAVTKPYDPAQNRPPVQTTDASVSVSAVRLTEEEKDLAALLDPNGFHSLFEYSASGVPERIVFRLYQLTDGEWKPMELTSAEALWTLYPSEAEGRFSLCTEDLSRGIGAYLPGSGTGGLQDGEPQNFFPPRLLPEPIQTECGKEIPLVLQLIPEGSAVSGPDAQMMFENFFTPEAFSKTEHPYKTVYAVTAAFYTE